MVRCTRKDMGVFEIGNVSENEKWKEKNENKWERIGQGRMDTWDT